MQPPSATPPHAGGSPRILFVPASGPGGAGEYMRCRILADACARRWPDARIHFVLNRNASYAHDLPYPTQLLDATPAHATPAVIEALRRIAPDVVIFDSTGRARQLACAKALGAACVFVSSRPNARRKGLRLNRIRHLDYHWVVQAPWASDASSAWERLKKRWYGGIRTLQIATLFEHSERRRRRLLLHSLQIAPRRYLAFCPGGGGEFGRGPRAADVMLAAATVLAASSQRTCVLVLGPNYGQPPAAPAGVVIVERLANASLMDLLHDAELVVTGGGATLLQTLALHKVCIAVPVAGDQPERIRRSAERGLVEPVDLDAAAICRAVTSLLADRQRRAALVRALRACGVRNDVHAAVAALASLLDARLPGVAHSR
ncbi:MAG: hypothetical protein IT480_08885 [Gammaproteobacteria bacterium]|nr:hypothetical protein [Gammaproteobacteria bacterium]